jgi:hypothetical protein
VRQNSDVDAKSAAAEMAAIGILLETLTSSDLADLDKLKTVDGGKFLAGTGRKLLTQMRALGHDPFADRLGIFSAMNVTLESSDEDSALLTIEVPEGPVTEYRFVRVERKWIPEDMAMNWVESIGEARARLLLLSPENLKDVKPRIMALLGAADDRLTSLLAAKNEKQFAAAIAEAEQAVQQFAPLIAELAGSTAGENPGQADPAADETVEQVTVVVKGRLDEVAQDEIRERLSDAVDEGRASQSEMTGDDEMTSYRVGPVADVDAFARRLGFLKVTRVDAKNRLVTAEPK